MSMLACLHNAYGDRNSDFIDSEPAKRRLYDDADYVPDDVWDKAVRTMLGDNDATVATDDTVNHSIHGISTAPHARAHFIVMHVCMEPDFIAAFHKFMPMYVRNASDLVEPRHRDRADTKIIYLLIVSPGYKQKITTNMLAMAKKEFHIDGVRAFVTRMKHGGKDFGKILQTVSSSS